VGTLFNWSGTGRKAMDHGKLPASRRRTPYRPRRREIRIDDHLAGRAQPVFAWFRRHDRLQMRRQGELATNVIALARYRDPTSPVSLDNYAVELNLLCQGATGIEVTDANKHSLANQPGGELLVPNRRGTCIDRAIVHSAAAAPGSLPRSASLSVL